MIPSINLSFPEHEFNGKQCSDQKERVNYFPESQEAEKEEDEKPSGDEENMSHIV